MQALLKLTPDQLDYIKSMLIIVLANDIISNFELYVDPSSFIYKNEALKALSKVQYPMNIKENLFIQITSFALYLFIELKRCTSNTPYFFLKMCYPELQHILKISDDIVYKDKIGVIQLNKYFSNCDYTHELREIYKCLDIYNRNVIYWFEFTDLLTEYNSQITYQEMDDVQVIFEEVNSCSKQFKYYPINNLTPSKLLIISHPNKKKNLVKTMVSIHKVFHSDFTAVICHNKFIKDKFMTTNSLNLHKEASSQYLTGYLCIGKSFDEFYYYFSIPTQENIIGCVMVNPSLYAYKKDYIYLFVFFNSLKIILYKLNYKILQIKFEFVKEININLSITSITAYNHINTRTEVERLKSIIVFLGDRNGGITVLNLLNLTYHDAYNYQDSIMSSIQTYNGANIYQNSKSITQLLLIDKPELLLASINDGTIYVIDPMAMCVSHKITFDDGRSIKHIAVSTEQNILIIQGFTFKTSVYRNLEKLLEPYHQLMSNNTKLNNHGQVYNDNISIVTVDTIDDQMFINLTDTNQPHKSLLSGIIIDEQFKQIITLDISGVIKMWDMHWYCCIQTIHMIPQDNEDINYMDMIQTLDLNTGVSSHLNSNKVIDRTNRISKMVMFLNRYKSALETKTNKQSTKMWLDIQSELGHSFKKKMSFISNQLKLMSKYEKGFDNNYTAIQAYYYDPCYRLLCISDGTMGYVYSRKFIKTYDELNNIFISVTLVPYKEYMQFKALDTPEVKQIGLQPENRFIIVASTMTYISLFDSLTNKLLYKIGKDCPPNILHSITPSITNSGYITCLVAGKDNDTIAYGTSKGYIIVFRVYNGLIIKVFHPLASSGLKSNMNSVKNHCTNVISGHTVKTNRKIYSHMLSKYSVCNLIYHNTYKEYIAITADGYVRLYTDLGLYFMPKKEYQIFKPEFIENMQLFNKPFRHKIESCYHSACEIYAATYQNKLVLYGGVNFNSSLTEVNIYNILVIIQPYIQYNLMSKSDNAQYYISHLRFSSAFPTLILGIPTDQYHLIVILNILQNSTYTMSIVGYILLPSASICDMTFKDTCIVVLTFNREVILYNVNKIIQDQILVTNFTVTHNPNKLKIGCVDTSKNSNNRNKLILSSCTQIQPMSKYSIQIKNNSVGVQLDMQPLTIPHKPSNGLNSISYNEKSASLLLYPVNLDNFITTNQSDSINLNTGVYILNASSIPYYFNYTINEDDILSESSNKTSQTIENQDLNFVKYKKILKERLNHTKNLQVLAQDDFLLNDTNTNKASDDNYVNTHKVKSFKEYIKARPATKNQGYKYVYKQPYANNLIKR